ncbi:hypothetical protein FHR83_008776 [Actinoplanes campanulatus]|uniref:Uncharacterized protein n=1 Tax=Actinoplanes campanulatus TaxID=113559 RepID=A0A7W5FJQ5_9ACTN|nr:hypothetical protein [Actinoplanes campanulatus]MBB3101048.1 hypothetical protein [Actinoplanes campanulatus]GGN49385.1 hypothetical protein GCM10010109_87410 [Actinoplanes campanulatus]GID41860.1 hypothetical protein Aca09nite_83660 [Actinoplanes campanulatus]
MSVQFAGKPVATALTVAPGSPSAGTMSSVAGDPAGAAVAGLLKASVVGTLNTAASAAMSANRRPGLSEFTAVQLLSA